MEIRGLIEIVAVTVGDGDMHSGIGNAYELLQIERGPEGPLIRIGSAFRIPAAGIGGHFRGIDQAQRDALIGELRAQTAPITREGFLILSRCAVDA